MSRWRADDTDSDAPGVPSPIDRDSETQETTRTAPRVTRPETRTAARPDGRPGPGEGGDSDGNSEVATRRGRPWTRRGDSDRR